MNYYNDDVLFWRNYEARKDKVFINFDKNLEMKNKFVKLIQEMKIKTLTQEDFI